MFGTQNKGGLFGQKPQTAAGGGGLFGNNQLGAGSGTQQQQPQQTLGGGLFGSQQQQQPQQQQPQQQQQQQTTFGGGGLFGNSANKPLFGSQPTQTQVPQQQTQQFGAQPAQQQQQQVPVITPFTRPSDLSEASQKELETMDSYIRQQIQLSEDLSNTISSHRTLVTSVPRDVQLLKFKLTAARETLKYDDNQLAKLRQLVEADYSDAELLTEVTNQPRKYDRLLPYFRRVVSRDDELDQLALAMRDVQEVVAAEEFGKRITYDEQGVKALPRAMREEYMYFMSLSDRVAELHRHIENQGDAEAFESTQS